MAREPTLDDILGEPAGRPDSEPSLRRLNVSPSTGSARGRKSTPLFAEVTRELEAGDMAQLETKLGVQPQPLQRVRDTHHRLARTVAEGYSHVEASALTGFSPSRISILMQDPAFNELVTFYRQRTDAAHADVIERMKYLSMDALQELQDRLQDQPESFKASELLEVMSRGFDRAGYGPSSTVQHKGEVLHSHEIRAIMEEAEKEQNVRSRVQDKADRKGDSRGPLLDVEASDGQAYVSPGQPQTASASASASADRVGAPAGQRAEGASGAGERSDAPLPHGDGPPVGGAE